MYRRGGVWAHINIINITKYSRRHLRYSFLFFFLCLHLVRFSPFCFVSFHLPSMSIHPSIPAFSFSFPPSVHRTNQTIRFSPSRSPSLLEVGVVRKGIDILLDHFIAELVLLLVSRWGERKKELMKERGRGKE